MTLQYKISIKLVPYTDKIFLFHHIQTRLKFLYKKFSLFRSSILRFLLYKNQKLIHSDQRFFPFLCFKHSLSQMSLNLHFSHLINWFKLLIGLRGKKNLLNIFGTSGMFDSTSSNINTCNIIINRLKNPFLCKSSFFCL